MEDGNNRKPYNITNMNYNESACNKPPPNISFDLLWMRSNTSSSSQIKGILLCLNGQYISQHRIHYLMLMSLSTIRFLSYYSYIQYMCNMLQREREREWARGLRIFAVRSMFIIVIIAAIIVSSHFTLSNVAIVIVAVVVVVSIIVFLPPFN